MARVLRFSGSSWATFLTTVNRSDATWRLEFRGVLPDTSTRILGDGSTSQNFVNINNATTANDISRYRVGNVSRDMAVSPGVTNDGELHDWAWVCNGSGITLEVDGVSSAQASGALDFKNFAAIALSNEASAGFDLEYLRYYSDDSGGTLIHDWDANASDHSSTTLADTVGGNDASFQGMGAEAWIDLGGDEPSEGVESSVSLSLDELGFAVTSTVTLPEPSSAANLSLGELTFAVSSTAALPTPVSAASLQLDGLSFAATSNVTLPAPVSAATLRLDELGFTAYAGGTLPTPVSSATLQLEPPGFDVSASATQSTPIASIGFSISELGFDAESAVTLPDVSSSVTMSLGELRFTVVVGEVVASKKYTFSLTPRKLSGALTTRKI